MAVDFIEYTKIVEAAAIQEAAASGLRSMEHLIFQLSHQSQLHRPPPPPEFSSSSFPPQPQQVDYRELTDFTVSKFRKVISILGRTGHARFRRGPPASSPASEPLPSPTPLQTLTHAAPPHLQVSSPAEGPPPPPPPPHPLPVSGHQTLTLDFTKPVPTAVARPLFAPPPAAAAGELSTSQYSNKGFSISAAAMSSATSSFMSSVTGDGSVSNGKIFQPAAAVSAGKPPLSSSLKKKCPEHAHSEQLPGSFAVAGGRCHCSKKRKSRVKRTIRVPAISSKIADIPPDEYSWRKYGQKPIKGSPYPRGYYKCSTLRGCPARKHVERAPDEPTMLIVTYEGEHRHAATPTPSAAEPGDAQMFDASR